MNNKQREQTMNDKKIQDLWRYYNLKGIKALIEHVKEDIKRFDDIEYTDITIATDFEQDPITGSIEWVYQTGDNSYTGSCYGYSHWAIGSVDDGTDSTQLAMDLVDQLEELHMYDELMSQC